MKTKLKSKMYHYRQELDKSSNKALGGQATPTKSDAWAVKYIPSSQNKKISSLVREAFNEPTPKSSFPSKTSATKKKREVSKPKSSRLIGSFHQNALEDGKKLRALEPTMKSMKSLAQVGAPNFESSQPFASRRRSKKLTSLTPAGHRHQQGTFEQDLMELGLGHGLPAPPHNPHGEKLVTIGGYIISLQPHNDKVHSVIRPRVSSEMDGLDLEVRIMGCPPSDIRVEKRYDTLVVIGFSSGGPVSVNNSQKNLEPKGIFADPRFKTITALINAQRTPDNSSIDIPREHLDRVHELVNVFVPKGISLNQIVITRPDPKGRMFVRGP